MTDTPRSAHLRALEAELLAMPPVAAMQLRVGDADGETLRLHAPLAPNINDKACAFGGSLTSLMTLAGWGLIALRLVEAGLDANVYVADTKVQYRTPVYTDLTAVAVADKGESWTGFLETLRNAGRAQMTVAVTVPLAEGGVAADSRSRYVAILKG